MKIVRVELPSRFRDEPLVFEFSNYNDCFHVRPANWKELIPDEFFETEGWLHLCPATEMIDTFEVAGVDLIRIRNDLFPDDLIE